MSNSELSNRNPERLKTVLAEGVNRNTRVMTADGITLGEAVRVHYRLDNIDPELRLYAAYLEVTRSEMGNTGFVPTDYIASYSQTGNKLTLSVSFHTFESETWERRPDFVARHQNRVEELPDGD
jgi:hypothetical protein